jgi:alanyl-tRNA synthetase
MNAQDIRNTYLKYYAERGHKPIPRAPLVLQNDPTTLFTGSGMQQLMPYLLGEPHPDGVRLVDSQPSFRAQDIEEVGDNRHTTFFEMLGNWSLGDYFKAEQLPWMFEFMIDVVGLDINKFYVTCFIGDEASGIPKDTESGEIWKNLFESKGVEAGEVEVGSEADGYKVGTPDGVKVFYYDASKNWWCRGGKIGDMPVGEPGGPDSEMFYRFDDSPHGDADKEQYGELCHPNCDCGRYMEIGNNVFMEYVRRESGFEKLPAQNVDQGAGLERIAAAALDSPDVFKISLLWPIIEKLQTISGRSYDSHTNSMRVIADHLRGATFLAVDGVVPSNKEQGYVMRRLVRRAVRFAFDLGVEQNFLEQVVPVIADLYAADYPEIKAQREDIIATMVKEEKVFRQTLRKGLQMLTKLGADGLNGEALFTLYDTFGFPVELSTEEAFKQDVALSADWQKEFDSKMQEQRARSQTAAKGVFKGGLGGQSEIHKKYHTATHLMYQALRTTLGEHVVQHGSNITEERLRFDFSHPDKLTPEQIKAVEDIVNDQIQADLKVSFQEYPTDVARGEMGALGAFGDRYGDTVKVYKMIADSADKPFSFEICGGPHVDHTLQLAEDSKKFKILKEESSSSGIRRIKAVLA